MLFNFELVLVHSRTPLYWATHAPIDVVSLGDVRWLFCFAAEVKLVQIAFYLQGAFLLKRLLKSLFSELAECLSVAIVLCTWDVLVCLHLPLLNNSKVSVSTDVVVFVQCDSRHEICAFSR